MSQPQQPVQVLKAEHQIILRVIRVLGGFVDDYERHGRFPVDSFRKCVTFIRLFADACHHGKEEDLLFPVLESRGIPREYGPIGVMLHEHQMARGLTKEMSAALDAVQSGDSDATARFVHAAKDYVDLLNNHIFKEDNILFTMGDRVMTPDDQQALSSRFCSVDCRVFEGHRREQLQKLADELEAERSQ